MLIAHVGIFRDKNGEMLIIPTWQQDGGPRLDSMQYSKLSSDYTEDEVGKKILDSAEISRMNEQEDPEQDVCKEASGLKTWKAFQKKYENVMISVLDTGEWKIARFLKQKGHSYGLNKDEVDKYTRHYKEALSAEELGKVVLEMFAMK
mgnify:CR=1 FL=1